MFWEKVKAQDFAVRVLGSHITKGRVAPTYLFTGEKGTGSEDLALAFARALQCERESLFQECGCGVCLKIARGNHPDVKIAGADPDAKSVKIEEIRELVVAASLKPYEGRWKVFMIKDAGRITIEAANALLKTLEEPPDKTVFILWTESRSNLLETIQSRAFEIRLKPLAAADSEPLTPALETLEQGNWEDFLDTFSTKPREEVKRAMDGLMVFLRGRIEKESRADRRHYGVVRALDVLSESKDALEANANQKLVLSRLAMKLREFLSRD